jgi:sugar/nucleoside kinase (ribokinase family)
MDIGYTPAILDINIVSNIASDNYLKTLARYKAKVGSWTEVQEYKDLNDICISLTNKDLENVLDNKDVKIEAGCTIAGAFSYYLPNYKESQLLYLGLPSSGNIDIFSKKFLEAIKKFNIKFSPLELEGNTSICLVSFHKEFPDRTMFFYNGFTKNSFLNMHPLENSLNIFSLFEVYRDLIHVDIDKIKKYKSFLAISLGTVKILDHSLILKVRSWLKAGIVTYLFGDIEEFRKIFHSDKDELLEKDIIKSIQINARKYNFISLVRDGLNGIIAIDKNDVFEEKSKKLLNLVNTNGAGEAGIGTFISAHKTTHDLKLSCKMAWDVTEKRLCENVKL